MSGLPRRRRQTEQSFPLSELHQVGPRAVAGWGREGGKVQTEEEFLLLPQQTLSEHFLQVGGQRPVVVRYLIKFVTQWDHVPPAPAQLHPPVLYSLR